MTVGAEEIRSFISENLLSGRQISLEEDLLVSGLIDSLGVVALVQHLEKVTSMPIPPEHVTLENFESVAKISAYINRD